MRTGRIILGFVAAAALAACGPKAEPPPEAAIATPAAQDSGVNRPAPPRTDTKFPGWLTIANQRGGGIVQYQPESIKREANGTAEIWVQILYTEPHTFVTDLKDVTQTIQYFRERFLYRFDCKLSRFHVMERNIMREAELVAETIPMPQRDENDWQSVGNGGVATVAYGPACKAVVAHPGAKPT